jgi:hypothetical protein
MFSTLGLILYVFGTLFLVSLCLTAGRRRELPVRSFEAEYARALALAAREIAYPTSASHAGGFDLKRTHS